MAYMQLRVVSEPRICHILLECIEPATDHHRVEAAEVKLIIPEREWIQSGRINLKYGLPVLSTLGPGKVEHFGGYDGLHAAHCDIVPKRVQRLQMDLLKCV